MTIDKTESVTSGSAFYLSPDAPKAWVRKVVFVRGPRTSKMDVMVVRLTGISIGSWQSSMLRQEPYYRSLVLTAVGRKTQLLRSVVLPYVEVNGERVVVASNGGGPAEPEWAKNMRADPRCWITVGRKNGAVVAGELEGDDRQMALDAHGKGRKTVYFYEKNTRALGRHLALFGLRAVDPSAGSRRNQPGGSATPDRYDPPC